MVSNIFYSVYDDLLEIFHTFQSVFSALFLNSPYSLLESVIPPYDTNPLLNDILSQLLDSMESIFPALADVTVFRFLCASALVVILALSWVKWLIGVVTD